MSKKKWVNQTADDVVTLRGSIWNDDTRIGHWSDYCPNCGAWMVEPQESERV